MNPESDSCNAIDAQDLGVVMETSAAPGAARSAETDPDLLQLIELWSNLSEATRRKILKLLPKQR